MMLEPFTAEAALRFVAREAQRCRDRDSCEMLALLFPSLCKVLSLQPYDDFQAMDFEAELHKRLRERAEREMWKAVPGAQTDVGMCVK